MSRKKREAARRRSRSRAPLALMIAGVAVLAVSALVYWRGASSSRATVPLEVTGRPALKADREKVDLGNIRLGKTVSVSFAIANVGDQTLRFTESPYIEVAQGC